MLFPRTLGAPPEVEPDPGCVCDGTGLRDSNHPGEGWCPLCGRGAILRARSKAQIPAVASRVAALPASNGRNAAVPDMAARAAVGGRGSDYRTEETA